MPRRPKTFFTADTHFGHANIIRYTKRPFETVAEMDATLVSNWNATVGPDDDVWHLGDVAHGTQRAEAILPRLNGRKHLIWGKHGSEAVRTWPGRASSQAYAELKLDGRRVVLFHYPIAEWNGFWHDSLHFYGHVHDRFTPTSLSCDVGVDVWDYRPAEFNDIAETISALAPPARPA
ncbi:metallophosphoesterase [Komagataeibacter sucrofermentans]|uniref:Metallophosphoesterase n=1 Tax=Komagataeibacter sucrofermentans TaxID=1053551 RepID=A0A318R2F6_9PROT|nr:metallophosphoesterase [Komagataeibacter sucrofermentans]PYD79933.1 metallophosphoesterase [Komagataeibacter sucrofermentans]GBQ52102.1 putative phosphoesterase [Komagataeibacter sucrofermentans DSM 15973]